MGDWWGILPFVLSSVEEKVDVSRYLKHLPSASKFLPYIAIKTARFWLVGIDVHPPLSLLYAPHVLLGGYLDEDDDDDYYFQLGEYNTLRPSWGYKVVLS